MALIVQKYGGTSVEGPENLRAIARRLVALRRSGADVIVVVSAMGQTTDEMHRLAYEVNPSPPQRELDMLVTAGERITMSLLAMAIAAEGETAISFTGSQSGIITDSAHGNATIREVRPFRIEAELAKQKIVIVAGYQGVSQEKEVTTLGRGGSDLTAIALAAAFRADRCELCKDVDGVFTADPRICPDARALATIPATAMLALAEGGSGVVYSAAVRYALEHGVEPIIRCTFSEAPGTRILLGPADSDVTYGLALTPPGIDPVIVTLVAGVRPLERLLDETWVPAPARRTDLSAAWPFPDRAAAEDHLRRVHAHLFARPRQLSL